MRLLINSFLLSGLLFFAGCSPSGDSEEPAVEPPPGRKLGEGEAAKGSINGQEWTFRGGRAFTFNKPQGAYIVVQLWSQYFADPCKEKTGSTLQARLTAPYLVASWNITPEDPFNANLSIFFTDLDFKPQPRDNMRVDQGEISFDLINPSEVTGYIAGSFRNPKVGGTSIAGDFAVPFCQYNASFGDNF